MLEQARQNYLSALEKKEESDVTSTVEYFEAAFCNDVRSLAGRVVL